MLILPSLFSKVSAMHMTPVFLWVVKYGPRLDQRLLLAIPSTRYTGHGSITLKNSDQDLVPMKDSRRYSKRASHNQVIYVLPTRRPRGQSYVFCSLADGSPADPTSCARPLGLLRGGVYRRRIRNNTYLLGLKQGLPMRSCSLFQLTPTCIST